MEQAIVTLHEVSKYYVTPQTVVKGLERITLSFTRGEFVAITGESGSGKSTLAKVLAGILPYENGEMLVCGRPTAHFDAADWERYRAERVSFVSQSYDILPGCTVMENIVAALVMIGETPAGAEVRAEEVLREVELWELRDRRAAKLSSGQKQRLSIARALAKPTAILIADEPTGNLDSANSAKVIELLARAAKDRLVLMVTHDFDEAAEVVTRRVILRDGAVVSDVILRPHAAPVRIAEAPAHRTPKKLGLFTACLQLRARPIWSAIVLAFFALTIFAVFAFMGTLTVALDPTPTFDYDNAAFRNGNDRRIVACRIDGAPLTEDDLQTILAIDRVESIERFGYLTDVQYAWQPDVDYRVLYSVDRANPDADAVLIDYIELDPSAMAFAQTVPLLPEGEAFLSAGRLPQAVSEVVAVGGEEMLGQSFALYLHDAKNWNRSAFHHINVTVVGVTDYGEGLYLHEDIGRVYLANARMYLAERESNQRYHFYTPAADLESGQARMEASYMQYLQEYDENGELIPVTFHFARLDALQDYNYDLPLELVGAHTSTFNVLVEVSPEDFALLTHADDGDQISITIEDYAYTDRVLDALLESGFAAVSPYREGSVIPNREAAADRVQTILVCLAAFVAVVALEIILLRAMFALQLESYRLLRHVGLNGVSAARSVVWQVLLLVLGGEAVGLGAIFLCAAFDLRAVTQILKYLPLGTCVVLWAVHFGASLFSALWVRRAVRKQVFPDASVAPDLAWEEHEEVQA